MDLNFTFWKFLEQIFAQKHLWQFCYFFGSNLQKEPIFIIKLFAYLATLQLLNLWSWNFYWFFSVGVGSDYSTLCTSLKKIRMQTLCSQLESKMSDERLNLLKIAISLHRAILVCKKFKEFMPKFHKKNTQSWIIRIFLSLRFYVKSILKNQ